MDRVWTTACTSCSGSCGGASRLESGEVALTNVGEAGNGGPVVVLSSHEWDEFRDGIKAGKFDSV